MWGRAAWGDAQKSFLPLTVPECLVVDLGGADSDGVVPVGCFAPHLGEEELQGPLVDAWVCCRPLMDWGERQGKNTLLCFILCFF